MVPGALAAPKKVAMPPARLDLVASGLWPLSVGDPFPEVHRSVGGRPPPFTAGRTFDNPVRPAWWLLTKRRTPTRQSNVSWYNPNNILTQSYSNHQGEADAQGKALAELDDLELGRARASRGP